MATQGLRIVLNFADADNNKEILKNLTLEYDDLQKIRNARDGFLENDERLRQEDLITLSGLDYDLEKEIVALNEEFSIYSAKLSNLNNARINIDFTVDLYGRAISPSFKFRKLNFDTGTLSLVDFSTSRRSAWSNFGLAQDSVFYGNNVRISGTNNGVDLTELNVQNSIVEKRFESQIPTHKIRVQINGDDYEFLAMKGIPVIFRGIFDSGVLRAEYNVLPGGQAPTIVVKNAEDNQEVIFPVENTAPDVSVLTQAFSLQSPLDRFLEIYYPGDNLVSLEFYRSGAGGTFFGGLGITDFPRVTMENLQTLIMAETLLTQIPDFRTYTPNLLKLDISDTADIDKGDILALRRLNNDVLQRIPLSVVELNLSQCFSANLNTESQNFVQFTDLEDLSLAGSTVKGLTYQVFGTAPGFTLPVGLKRLELQDNDLYRLPGSVVSLQQLQYLNISNVALQGPFFDLWTEFLLGYGPDLFPPQNLDSMSGSLVNLIYGGPSTDNIPPFSVQGYTAIETYTVNYYPLGLFIFYNEFDPINGEGFWFGCSSLKEINFIVASDEIFPITGNFPNFATNTSLEVIDFKGTSWGSASQDFSIEFNTFGSQEEGSGCRSTLTDLVIHNTGPGFFSQGFNFEKPIHPDAFKFMISLERIEFRGTFVGGNIPDLIDCESLESIVFQSCGITGQLPSFSGNPMLNEISFPNNELSGQVPSLNLPILQNIFLSNNSIIGFGDLTTPQLQRLYVEDNLIASFPAIGQSTQLRELDLARNLISDYPTVNNAGPLRNLRFIEKINLSDNSLSTGNIDLILEDLNANYDENPTPRGAGAVVNLLGNSPPSTTARNNAIINKLRLGGWQVDVDV